MSLFGSIYESDGDGPDAAAPDAAAPDAAAPDAAAPDAAAPDAAAPNAPAQGSAGDASEPASGSSSMSLQDFAAEVFGSARPAGEDPSPAPAVDLPRAGPDPDPPRPSTDSALDVLADAADGGLGARPEVDASATVVPPSGGGSNALAGSAEVSSGRVATLESGFADLVSAPELDEPAGSDPDALPVGEAHNDPGDVPQLDPAPVPVSAADGFDTLLHLDDDLLPADKPKRRMGVPKPGLANLGRPVKLLVVLLVVGIAGFMASRALAGGGGDGTADPAEGVAGAGTIQLGDLPVSGALDPRNAGAAINTAQLAGAESELRTAAISAQAHYAETGSFALPASEWTDLVGRTIVDGTSGTPAPRVLRVVSDDDAACFETATDAGATVAVGVTDGLLGFASDPAGGTLCTVDAAELRGWEPSLLGA